MPGSAEVAMLGDDPHPTAALIVVAQGTVDAAQELASAVERHHPEWVRRGVWCGDPQLRPPARQLVEWAEPPRDFGRRLVAMAPDHFEWHCALTECRSLFAAGVERIVALWAGSIALLGSVGELARGDGMVVVRRVLGSLPDDGCWPTEADLMGSGPFSEHVASFGHGDGPTVTWLLDHLDDDSIGVGRWLARATELFPAAPLAADDVGAGPWNWPETEARVVDAPAFDPAVPWVLDHDRAGRARIEVGADARRVADLQRAAPQLAGRRTPVMLPGALWVDDVVRRGVAAAPEGVPEPWSDPVGFRRWLEPRYWEALRRSRPDLQGRFAEPFGADSVAWRAWTSAAFAAGQAPITLRPVGAGAEPLAVAASLDRSGVNLVGYHTLDFSLGDVVRRLGEALRAAEVPTSTVATMRSASPPLDEFARPEQRVSSTTTVAVVTADQFPMLRADHPELFAATERMIGYWFWELEDVPRAMRRSIALVDEIWAGSRFVVDAFAAVAEVPVRHVPIPVPAPRTSDLRRLDFLPLRAVGERTMFLVAFDHFSITERKNPIGAISAFRQAFAPDEGPVLVIKSMNGSQRWPQHQQVVAAAHGRADIIVWDEHLTRPDQMALVAAADCLVSLHRSEGLGLHLAEAMWLGTPTIATRYSGNLDFQDDECALLIDADRVHVTGGQGVYPESALWADPDLQQAGAAMRRIADEPALRQRLADDALARMKMQPTLADTGRAIAHLLHGGD